MASTNFSFDDQELKEVQQHESYRKFSEFDESPQTEKNEKESEAKNNEKADLDEKLKEEEENKGILESKKWTKIKFFYVACILFTMLMSTSGYALIAPFFPTESKKKGFGDLENGIIVAAFQLCNFLLSPVYGTLVSYHYQKLT